MSEIHVCQDASVDDIVAANGEHVVCFGHDYDDYGSVGVEDAHLIAAAPELLEVLSDLVSYIVNSDDEPMKPGMRQRVNEARKAIAKAEGGR